MSASRSLYRALALSLGRLDVDPEVVEAVAIDLKKDNIEFSFTRFGKAVDAARPPKTYLTPIPGSTP